MPRTKGARNKPKVVDVCLDMRKLPEDVAYCRKCEKVKAKSNFYETTNPVLDGNGLLSLCKDCCQSIYDSHFSLVSMVDKAIQLTCQDLDVRFSLDAVNATISQMSKEKEKGKTLSNVFGTYKGKLFTTAKTNAGMELFRYKDSEQAAFGKNDVALTMNNDIDEVEDKDLQMFWGGGFTNDDIEFLERELSEWKSKHKCDTTSELTLLKEICIKILEVRKKRASGHSPDSELKGLQELMKTAAVDPAKMNAADHGKSKDSFGMWIKDIEEYEPAEYFEDKKMFSDFDGIKSFVRAYIYRPLRNLLTGSRDFNIDLESSYDTDDIEIETKDEGGDEDAVV